MKKNLDKHLKAAYLNTMYLLNLIVFSIIW